MKKVVVLSWVISTWMMLLLTPTALPIHWYLGSSDADQYSTSLTQLRSTAKDSKLIYFGIPMMPKSVKPSKYILVVLTSDQEHSITIAMDANNLYVVAYSDMFNDNPRAYFFKDAPSNAKNTLFLDAKTAKQYYTLSYNSRYDSIVAKTKMSSRSKVHLGVQKLNNRLNRVYGEAIKEEADQAEFLLIAIQTIAEAARFSYIERQIKSKIRDFEFTPDAKLLDLESEWGKISGAVRNAKSNGDFKAKIELKDATGKKYYATKVEDVKPDIALLNYVA